MKLVLLLILSACSANARRVDALTLYQEQLKACQHDNTTRAAVYDCQAKERAKWDDAGAPPASVDGGAS